MPTRSVTLEILGDDRGARAAIDWINAESDKIDSRKPTVQIGADTKPAEGPMAGLRTAIATLTDRFYTVDFNANDSAFNATMASMMVKLTALQQLGDRPILSRSKLAQSKADVLGLASAFDNLISKQKAVVDAAHQAAIDEAHLAAIVHNKAIDRNIAGLTGWGGQNKGAAGLMGTIPLFGGIAGIAGWHLALDGLIEAVAKIGPAAIALAAFGGALVALAPTVSNMVSAEKAMYTTSQALGTSMYGLNGGLTAINQQFRPAVVSLWGDAIKAAGSGTGTLTSLLSTTVPFVQRLAAVITVDLTNGTGKFMNLVHQGQGDLKQLDGIFHSIANSLLNLMKVANQTNIATGLFGVIGVAAKLLDLVTRLPAPLLAVALGLHGMYVWGGLAATGLSKIAGVLGAIPGLGGLKVLQDIPGALDKMAAGALTAKTGLDFTVKGLQGVATNAEGAAVKTSVFRGVITLLGAVPVWGWVALATAGVIAIGLAFLRTKSAAQIFLDSLNQGISRANNFQVFNLMATDIGLVNQKMNQIPSASKVMTDALTHGSMASKNAYDTVVSSIGAATAAQGQYQSATSKVVGQMLNFGTNVGTIMKQFGVSYPVAIAIANQAGVKLTDNMTGNSKAAQILRQQISGLMTGFGQLAGPTGIAGADFQALAYSSSQVTQKIGQLNSAWSSWTKSVTNTQSTFDAFAQGMGVLNDSAGKFTWKLGMLKVSGIQTKAAIDDLSASGINLNQAFTDEVMKLDEAIAASRTAGGSTAQLTTIVKAGIAALVPYAKGSQEATAQLYALALQAGYTGNNSIAALSNWTGIKAPAALGIMKKATDAETVAASNLANTIQNLLNVQFQADIVKASGASAALQKFTTDLVNNQLLTRQGQTDRQNLINDLVKAGLHADQAAKFVDGLSTSLGKIPPTETVTISMSGDGKYTITGASILASQGPGGSGNAAGGLAEGWRVPGYGGGDRWPAMLEGGEAVVPKHLVAPIAPYLSAHGVPGFASGGFVGSGSYSGGVPGLSGFAYGMHDTFQHDMIHTMTTGMVTVMNSISKFFASSGGGANGGAWGASQWAPVILQALSMLGQPASYLGAVEYRMNVESGGNPYAINKWDSNWLAGTPSVGLMQVIGPTFAAYAGMLSGIGPFAYGVSENPLANTYAGLAYALGAYGNIPGPMLQPGGYYNGGILSEPMLAVGASGRSTWLAERGPELITPLARGNPTSFGQGVSDTIIYIKVDAGDAIDPNAVARSIHEKLRRYKTKKGGGPLGLS